jgi:hypothetical protein
MIRYQTTNYIQALCINGLMYLKTECGLGNSITEGYL